MSNKSGWSDRLIWNWEAVRAGLADYCLQSGDWRGSDGGWRYPWLVLLCWHGRVLAGWQASVGAVGHNFVYLDPV